MDIIKEFLEHSTIHGLVYISKPRILVRLFWILVVIAGFTGSGVIIYQSFDNWAQSPIKTTIETLPITEITLPKVTVCPPKNSDTNLNYDLLMTKNMTVDNETRYELTKYAVGLIQDHVYEDIMSNLSLLVEDNRYVNWYNGFSVIQLPFWGKDANCNMESCSDDKLRIRVKTYATSGAIYTKHFGEKFDGKIIERQLSFIVFILTPEDYQDNTNISVQLNIEKNVLGIEKFYSDNEQPVTTLQRTKQGDTEPMWYFFQRDLTADDISDLSADVMSGFSLKWSSDVISIPPDFDSISTDFQLYFIRLHSSII